MPQRSGALFLVAGVVALPYVRNMTTATVTSKGQVTIPAEIRRKLRLHAGSKIDFVENKAGEMVIRSRTGNIRELYGFLKYDGPPLTIEQMDEAIGKGAVEHFKRSQS